MGTHPHVVVVASLGQEEFSRFWKLVNQLFARWYNSRQVSILSATEPVRHRAPDEADSREEAIRITKELMELHKKHWPGFEGESEMRPMFDPGMAP